MNSRCSVLGAAALDRTSVGGSLESVYSPGLTPRPMGCVLPCGPRLSSHKLLVVSYIESRSKKPRVSRERGPKAQGILLSLSAASVDDVGW